MTGSGGDPSNNPSQANGGDSAGGDESNSKRTKRKNPRGKPKSSFTASTDKMEGHVFQTFNESENKSQSKKICDALGRYISRKLDHAEELQPIYTKQEIPNIGTPKESGEEDKNDEKKKLLWVESVKTYHKRKTALSDNVRHVYSTIWG